MTTPVPPTSGHTPSPTPVQNPKEPTRARPGYQGSARHAPDRGASADPKGKKQPESVALMLKLWLGAAIVEAVHQLVTVIIGFTNSDALIAGARKQMREMDQPFPDEMARIAGYGSIIIGALIAFLIVGLLLWMLAILRKPGKHAGIARRIWFAFSIYFGLRVLLIFLATPAGSDAPDWLIMADGILVILAGVAAILGLIFSLRRETLDYTGELDQLRQFEREQRAAMEEKQREKQEKEREKKRRKDSQNSSRDKKAGKR